MARVQSHGIENYHLATLILLEEYGGSFTLGPALYREFLHKMGPLLKDEDYEPYRSEPSYPRWKNKFRWSLKHMRDDGRLKYHGHQQYENADSGRDYLQTAHLPLELMTEEIEFLEDGRTRVSYFRPDGTLDVEFEGGASTSGADDLTDLE